jgi:hypothetical protein
MNKSAKIMVYPNYKTGEVDRCIIIDQVRKEKS